MPDLDKIPFDPEAKVRKKVPVSCRCRAEKQRQQELRDQQEKEMQAIEALKKQSLMDERLRSATFDRFKKTEHNAWNLKLCLRYAEHFDEMLEKNQGLLFYGGGGDREDLCGRLHCQPFAGAAGPSCDDLLREAPGHHEGLPN